MSLLTEGTMKSNVKLNAPDKKSSPPPPPPKPKATETVNRAELIRKVKAKGSLYTHLYDNSGDQRRRWRNGMQECSDFLDMINETK